MARTPMARMSSAQVISVVNAGDNSDCLRLSAPARTVLEQMSVNRIVRTMDFGAMMSVTYGPGMVVLGLWGAPFLSDVFALDAVDRGNVLLAMAITAPVGLAMVGLLSRFVPSKKRIILFCAGGGRSVLATLALEEMGYDNVAHVEAGFGGWQKAELPVEDVASTSRWVRREV